MERTEIHDCWGRGRFQWQQFLIFTFFSLFHVNLYITNFFINIKSQDTSLEMFRKRANQAKMVWSGCLAPHPLAPVPRFVNNDQVTVEAYSTVRRMSGGSDWSQAVCVPVSNKQASPGKPRLQLLRLHHGCIASAHWVNQERTQREPVAMAAVPARRIKMCAPPSGSFPSSPHSHFTYPGFAVMRERARQNETPPLQTVFGPLFFRMVLDLIGV